MGLSSSLGELTCAWFDSSADHGQAIFARGREDSLDQDLLFGQQTAGAGHGDAIVLIPGAIYGAVITRVGGVEEKVLTAKNSSSDERRHSALRTIQDQRHRISTLNFALAVSAQKTTFCSPTLFFDDAESPCAAQPCT